MKLEQLLEGVSYTLVQGSLELDIEDIIYDSRKAAPGRLFVCIVGTQRDSHDYAAQCVADGVTALVVQHDIDLSTVPGAAVPARCRTSTTVPTATRPACSPTARRRSSRCGAGWASVLFIIPSPSIWATSPAH